jgi:hypothetical protein
VVAKPGREPPMKKSRTRSSGGEALACPPLATVQVPLPLLDILADTRTAFFGLCLEAGSMPFLVENGW